MARIIQSGGFLGNFFGKSMINLGKKAEDMEDEDMDNIIKIVKSLGNSGLLLDGAT